MILSFPYLLGFLAIVYARAPQVTIGDTTLVGLDITELGLDFFGGMNSPFSYVCNDSQAYRNSFRRASPRYFALATTRSQNKARCEDFRRQQFRPRVSATSKSILGPSNYCESSCA
jgi:hypothetical protein